MKVVNTLDIAAPVSISKVGPDITALSFNDRGGLMAYADTKGEIKVDFSSEMIVQRGFKEALHSKLYQPYQGSPCFGVYSKDVLTDGRQR